MIVVAADGGAPSKERLVDRWAEFAGGSPGAGRPRNGDPRPLGTPILYDDVPVLTDGYAPTDALLVT